MFLISANGLTTLVDSLAKLYSDEVGGVQFAWGYFAASSVLLLAFAMLRDGTLNGAIATRRPLLQLLRAAMLVGTISTLFVGLAYLPLADTIAISFAAPLLVTVLAVPVLGEQVGPHRTGAVLVGFVGVIVVMQPGGGLFHWAFFLPLASAVFFACFQIITRMLAATEDAFTTLFYTSIGGFVCSTPIAVFFWDRLAPLHLVVFAGAGVLGVVAHYCMFKAYQFSQASLLAPFNYAKLLWGVLLGYLLFADWPAEHVMTGSAIIVASGVYIVVRERKAVR